MAQYSMHTRRNGLPRRVVYLALILIGVILVATAIIWQAYDRNLRPVGGNKVQYVTIVPDSSASQIAGQLYDAGLIRASWAFEWYVSSHSVRDSLKAGTYKLSPGQSTAQIANMIAEGKVAADLVTILPGKRIDEIRQAFIEAGFKPDAVDAALEASRYKSSYPALADNPSTASLEGFLYPESFQKTADTDPSEIIGESLTIMQKHLTTDIRTGFARQGLSVYQGVTLASIVEKEVSTPEDRAVVAQIFLKRLKNNMNLGADATAPYGAVLAGRAPSLTYDSPYNTLLHKGLPPSPISNVTDSALRAVAHPAATDWLYFVSGDDGATHYAMTLEEHQANVDKYCHEKCSATR